MNQLKALLKTRHRKQVWLAEELGVHPVTVSNWVRGHQRPDHATVRRIADMLQCEPDEITGGYPLMTDAERRHLNAYRALPPDARQAIDAMMKALTTGPAAGEQNPELAIHVKKSS